MTNSTLTVAEERALTAWFLSALARKPDATVEELVGVFQERTLVNDPIRADLSRRWIADHHRYRSRTTQRP